RSRSRLRLLLSGLGSWSSHTKTPASRRASIPRTRFETPPIPVLCAQARPKVLGWSNFALTASLGRYRLLDNVASTAGVNLHARTHRGRERDGADIAALGRRRLGADQLVHHRRVVLEQAAVVEFPLADHQMHDRVAVGPVLDLSGLGLLDRFGDIHRDGADL